MSLQGTNGRFKTLAPLISVSLSTTFIVEWALVPCGIWLPESIQHGVFEGTCAEVDVRRV